ncbi:hypothetical protein G4L39_01040 [Limisphaera ngatamarikiensis]|uniref:FixH family protein n=1 Tax=Limisphaera ngatamarikiensis TaxID=1324935 RepID=A0A6M1RK14_9BACT|nr:FixH family protein [Limisphaera ngatamarikiensis]NGO37983.1 hypothetical protein [Limisphaera ngatamarikiensis]
MKASERSSGGSLWPAGLVTAFVLFVAGTAALVWVSRRANLDLVRPDYYEAEQVHDAEQARRDRASALAPRLRLTLDDLRRRLLLQLPPGHEGATGRVVFYRPSAAAMDREWPLQPDGSGLQEISVRDLASGLWRVRVIWTNGGVEYEETGDFVLRGSGEDPAR